MSIQSILADLKQERARIQKAIDVLENLASVPPVRSRRGRPPKSKHAAKAKRRTSGLTTFSRDNAFKERRAARKRQDDDWGGPLIRKSLKAYRAH